MVSSADVDENMFKHVVFVYMYIKNRLGPWIDPRDTLRIICLRLYCLERISVYMLLLVR